MFGKITESLCNELFWVFSAEDFKNALACFVFDFKQQSDEINDLIKVITMRFQLMQAEYKGGINDWAKEMFSEVVQFFYFQLQSIFLFLIAIIFYCKS